MTSLQAGGFVLLIIGLTVMVIAHIDYRLTGDIDCMAIFMIVLGTSLVIDGSKDD